jgi:hypothetical protein
MVTGTVGSAPPGRTLAQLAAIGDLSDEAQELLQPEHRLDGYVQALMGAELAADAVRILALVLPTREAVWWAWMCAGSRSSLLRSGTRRATKYCPSGRSRRRRECCSCWTTPAMPRWRC